MEDDKVPSAVTSATTLPTVLTINVGGTLFTTLRSTLCRFEDSMLASMFSGRHDVAKDSEGRIFIDADPASFEHILRYLRREILPILISSSNAPKTQLDVGLMPNEAWGIYREALYFGIDPLASYLHSHSYIFNRIVQEKFSTEFAECRKARNAILEILMRRMDHFTRMVEIIVHYEKFRLAVNSKEDEINASWYRIIERTELEECDEKCDADLVLNTMCLEKITNYSHLSIVNDLREDGFKVESNQRNHLNPVCSHTSVTLRFSL